MSQETELNRLKLKKEDLIKEITQKASEYLEFLKENDIHKVIQHNIAEEIVNLEIRIERRAKEKVLKHTKKIVKKHLSNLNKSYSSQKYYSKHPDKALNDKIKKDVLNYLKKELALDSTQLSKLKDCLLFTCDDFVDKGDNGQEGQKLSEEISDLIEQLGATSRKIRELEKDLRKGKEIDKWDTLIDDS